ncbi:MAG: ABC transporter ATP-binding protein [Mariprofundaceae bacterium]|nr:ABC transporter ATP-binding protein [Mariprofundaceae bacterium]
MSDHVLLEAGGLCKYYHSGGSDVAALDQVDFQLEKGAFTVLSGRSGSGKTTLLNMVGLLDTPDMGSLHIAGENVLALSLSERANFRLQRIGFVFQAYNLIRVLSARENIAYVLQLRGMKKTERLAIADHWLFEVGLDGLGNRRPDQLSGGQQQRVAVARALASKPALVLADEPTANLDSVHGESLMSLMRDLNDRCGMTFLIASHDPVAMAAAQQCVYMQDGRIVSVATP